METTQLRYDTQDGIATIRFERPDSLNAWTPVMETEMREAIRMAEDDPAIRVIVLTGAGRAFCAGADLNAVNQGDYYQQQAKALAARKAAGETRFGYLLETRKPLVAALNGAAIGVGLVIALHCDLRYARAGAKLSFAFPRRGLASEQGVALLLPRLVGVGVATDLLLSGRVVLAEEAHKLGLVNDVATAETFKNTWWTQVNALAEHCSPLAMWRIKRQIRDGFSQSYAEAVAAADTDIAACRAASDAKEGVASFLEKRLPRFSSLPSRSAPLN